MIKKFLIKSNEWYDGLLEPKRFVFFLITVGGSFTMIQIMAFLIENAHKTLSVMLLPMWITILFTWRFGYKIIGLREHMRKQKQSKKSD